MLFVDQVQRKPVGYSCETGSGVLAQDASYLYKNLSWKTKKIKEKICKVPRYCRLKNSMQKFPQQLHSFRFYGTFQLRQSAIIILATLHFYFEFLWLLLPSFYCWREEYSFYRINTELFMQ